MKTAGVDDDYGINWRNVRMSLVTMLEFTSRLDIKNATMHGICQ